MNFARGKHNNRIQTYGLKPEADAHVLHMMKATKPLLLLICLACALGCSRRDMHDWRAVSSSGDEQEGRLDRMTWDNRLPEKLKGGFSGVYREWTKMGVQVFETRWKSGVLHGITLEFDTKGIPDAVVPYVDGQIHGTVFDLYPSGARQQEVSFVRGLRHGTSLMWSASGQLANTVVYEDGELKTIKGVQNIPLHGTRGDARP
jgi:hypothetical protein